MRVVIFVLDSFTLLIGLWTLTYGTYVLLQAWKLGLRKSVIAMLIAQVITLISIFLMGWRYS